MSCHVICTALLEVSDPRSGDFDWHSSRPVVVCSGSIVRIEPAARVVRDAQWSHTALTPVGSTCSLRLGEATCPVSRRHGRRCRAAKHSEPDRLVPSLAGRPGRILKYGVRSRQRVPWSLRATVVQRCAGSIEARRRGFAAPPRMSTCLSAHELFARFADAEATHSPPTADATLGGLPRRSRQDRRRDRAVGEPVRRGQQVARVVQGSRRLAMTGLPRGTATRGRQQRTGCPDTQ
jgi:hypothetical protein